MLKVHPVHELIPSEIIKSKIFFIRGKKVMLDRHLAELYGVETRALNQAVGRNSERFPADFMFQLTRQEIRNLSQIVISLKHAPRVFVFTEQGVAMLSGVLNSKRAIQVNIQIMRAFIKLRELVTSNEVIRQRVESLERKFSTHDEKIQLIFEAIKELLEPPLAPQKKRIGFHA